LHARAVRAAEVAHRDRIDAEFGVAARHRFVGHRHAGIGVATRDECRAAPEPVRLRRAVRGGDAEHDLAPDISVGGPGFHAAYLPWIVSILGPADPGPEARSGAAK